MSPDRAVQQALLGLIKGPGTEVRPEARLDDLGLRSLQRVQLAVALEELLGRPVKDATVMRARTVADLVNALAVV